MRNICNRQATTSTVLTLSVLSLLWYLTLLLDPGRIGHPVAYAMLLVAEGIGMVQLLGIWLTIIAGKPQGIRYDVMAAQDALRKNPALAGRVAVFIPVAGEPMEIISKTVLAARDIRFPHTTHVLDDGRSDDVKALAASLGVGYLRRADRKGWKAGNVNNALARVPCDYFVILDADHVADSDFLIETLPWIVSDPQVAFVQTPQHFVNTDSFVGGGVAETQEIFYRHIQTGKNAFNSAFCVGTNVVFRAEIVRDMGGMYAGSRSEDIWTSLLLHERGWKSVYLPLVLAKGLAPETVDGYLRQQFRWASGCYELLFYHNPLFSRSLTLDQRLQYLHTSLFFLSGVSVFIFYLLPLLYVYFGWKPIIVQEGGRTWLMHFLPYFAFTYVSISHLLGRFPKWRTFVVSMGAFPAHISAGLGVLTGARMQWSVSGVIRSNIDYAKEIMFHLVLLPLTFAAIPVLIANEPDTVTAALMTGWLLWNGSILFSFCKQAIPSLAQHRAPEAAASLGYATPA